MAWYSSWTRAQRLAITVPTGTTAALSYFSVVLTAASLPTELTNNTYGRSDGGDLAFAADLGAGNSVSSIGAQLPCEVVSASFGGSPSAEIHVQVPSVAATGTLTYIWVLYGNSGQTAQPAVSSTYGSQAVWNENGTQNYQGVWHLGNGTTLSTADSTSQANNGQTSGNLPTASAAGIFGGAANFSGSGQYIHTTNTVNVYPGTFSVWAKSASTTVASYTGLLSNYYGGSHNGWALEVYPGSTDYNCYYFNNSANYANGESGSGFGALTTSWTLLHGVITSSGLSLYYNGAFIRTVSWSGTATPCTSTYPAYIGSLSNIAGLFAGLMDEGRISAVVRSASWIAAEYANQSAPGTFIQSSGSPLSTSGTTLAAALLLGF